LTELADTLARDRAVPFKTAHAIAGRLMAARASDASRPLGSLLAEVSRDLLGAPIEYTDAELMRILSPRHFVDVRKTLGGPAPEETGRAATASRQQLHADQDWWTKATTALAVAE